MSSPPPPQTSPLFATVSIQLLTALSLSDWALEKYLDKCVESFSSPSSCTNFWYFVNFSMLRAQSFYISTNVDCLFKWAIIKGKRKESNRSQGRHMSVFMARVHCVRHYLPDTEVVQIVHSSPANSLIIFSVLRQIPVTLTKSSRQVAPAE